MNILITGIHGFVGTNLVQALKANHTIYGLDIINPEIYLECDSKSRPEYIKTYSWNELDALPPIDVVIHLAGKAHDTKNQTVAQTYFDINTGLTQKIYDWFRASSATKFIFFSSVKAAADKVDGILTEEVKPAPIGPYGESKIAAESYLLGRQTTDYRQQFLKTQTSNSSNLKPETQNVFILRPCMIHGPGNKGNLNLLYNVVKKGIPYPLGAFENRRSFCSIDNLSFVINGLITSDVTSGIYNVCDDETVSTNELIELISASLGKNSRIWHFNKMAIVLAAKAGSVLHLPLNTERLQKLTENYVVSNSKIKSALGISAMPISAAKGLANTLKSFSL